MRLTEQLMITEAGQFELRKIVSAKLTEEERLPAPVRPLLVLGVLLILLLHPLCSLLCFAPAAWLAVCRRKVSCAAVTVCMASNTYVVRLSDKGQFQELEAAISKAKSK